MWRELRLLMERIQYGYYIREQIEWKRSELTTNRTRVPFQTFEETGFRSAEGGHHFLKDSISQWTVSTSVLCGAPHLIKAYWASEKATNHTLGSLRQAVLFSPETLSLEISIPCTFKKFTHISLDVERNLEINNTMSLSGRLQCFRFKQRDGRFIWKYWSLPTVVIRVIQLGNGCMSDNCTIKCG